MGFIDTVHSADNLLFLNLIQLSPLATLSIAMPTNWAGKIIVNWFVI